MTLVYRDPTLLASTLTPLVDLATKVVQLQYKLDPESTLHVALKAAEDRIAQCIGEYLEVKAQASDSAEGGADQDLKVGDRVRIARKSEARIDAMARTLGQIGTVREVGGSMLDNAVRVVLEDGDWWWYSVQDLDLVSNRTTDEDSK